MTYYYIALTVVTFVIWCLDKFRAKVGQWRVPERILLTLTILGGAFGALAGMMAFRHKTRKTYFWIIVTISSLVHGYLWIISL